MLPRSDRDDDVLFASEHVGHRRTRRAGWKLGLPQHLTGSLIMRTAVPAPGANESGMLFGVRSGLAMIGSPSPTNSNVFVASGRYGLGDRVAASSVV